jgi:HlyD family secretion protein
MGRKTAGAEKPGTLSLVPGMPTEICLATAGQTALACMAKPVMDQVERALREE